MTMYYSPSQNMFFTSTVGMPSDGAEISDATYATLRSAQLSGSTIGPDSNGNPVATAPTPTSAQLQAQYANALTDAINSVAQSWQYDTVYTAATYLTSTVTQFQNEAKALVAWRDTAWSNAQALLAQVQAGTATMPATSAAFLTAVLPTAPTRPAA
jgi:hypothetical protein